MLESRKIDVLIYLNQIYDINLSYRVAHFHMPRNNTWWLGQQALRWDLSLTTMIPFPHTGWFCGKHPKSNKNKNHRETKFIFTNRQTGNDHFLPIGKPMNLQTCRGIVAAGFSLLYYSDMDINVPSAHCNKRNIYLILGAFVELEALFSLRPMVSLNSIKMIKMTMFNKFRNISIISG